MSFDWHPAVMPPSPEKTSRKAPSALGGNEANSAMGVDGRIEVMNRIGLVHLCEVEGLIGLRDCSGLEEALLLACRTRLECRPFSLPYKKLQVVADGST